MESERPLPESGRFDRPGDTPGPVAGSSIDSEPTNTKGTWSPPGDESVAAGNDEKSRPQEASRSEQVPIACKCKPSTTSRSSGLSLLSSFPCSETALRAAEVDYEMGVGAVQRSEVSSAVGVHVAGVDSSHPFFIAGGQHGSLFERIAATVGVDPDELEAACRTSSRPFARPRRIPKGKGKKGWRVIERHHDGGTIEEAHEAANTLLAPLILHLSRAAYGVRGRSLEDALRPHMGKRWFARIDIVDFFPTVSPRLLRHALRHELGETDPRSIRLFMSQRHLPQGAKASPAISNLVLVGFDRAILRAAGAGGGYTRYVDDLFVSGDDRAEVERLMVFIRHGLRQLGFRTKWSWDPKRALGYSVRGRRLSVGRSERDRIRAAIHRITKRLDNLVEEEARIRSRIVRVRRANPRAGRRLQAALDEAIRSARQSSLDPRSTP